MNIIDILPREGFDPFRLYAYEIYTATGWQEVCRFGGARWASALREACEERAEGHSLAPAFWTRDLWHEEGLGYPDWEWVVEIPGQPVFEFDDPLDALAAYEQATINHGWMLIHADLVPALVNRRMREVQSTNKESLSVCSGGGGGKFEQPKYATAGFYLSPETRITVNGKTFTLGNIDKEMTK